VFTRSLIAKTTVRVWLPIALALVGNSSGAGQVPSQPRAQPIFPSGVELVAVDVVVLDRHGNPVEGLTRADFSVKENGQPQTIAAFEAMSLRDSPAAPRGRQRISTNTGPPESAGRWFFVVFDDANISRYSTPRAREAVVQFVDRALRAGDRVMIAPTSGGAWWTGSLPDDRESLAAFVARLQGAWWPDTTAARLWDHEAMSIALGRDRQALAQVARRYFEANIIPEAYPMDRELSRELDVSPGIALIQAKAREVYREARVRLDASLGTLDRIATALALIRGRKTLLLVSEGFVMDPSETRFRLVLQSARNANVAVHFVDVRSPDGMLGQAGMPGGAVEFSAAIEDRDTTTALAFAAREAEGAYSVAIDTGGRTVAGVKLADELVKIAAESRNYYLLGYSPTDTRRDGRFRKIEVIVNRPDVDVRARGGYYAASDKEAAPVRTDELDPAVRAAIDAPFGTPGIPLRLTSYVFGPQAEDKVQVVLLAEADIAPLRLEPRSGLYLAELNSYVVVQGRDSGDTKRDERLVELTMPPDVFEEARRTGVPMRREFLLAPGAYQVTLVVRDRASRLLGSVRHEFEVPAISEFRISTPVVTDTLQPAAPGQPVRPVPIARRTFPPGARLFCMVDVYGATSDVGSWMPRVSLGYSLRRADGTDVVAAPLRPLTPGALGQVSATVALTLPMEAAGEHELRLIVRDEVSARTLEVSEPLVVAPR